MTDRPFHWLKQIEQELDLAKRIPLWGHPPDFPWDLFSKELETYLQIEPLEIFASKKEFLEPSDLLSCFGETPFIRTLELSPLNGTATLIISQESVRRITESVLFSNSEGKGFSDPSFQEGFYQYLLLRTSECFEKLQPYPGLHIQWLERTKDLDKQSFACDLQIKIKEESFLARLVFSQEFQLSFSDYFAKTSKIPYSSPLIQSIDLSLQVEAGGCTLSQKEWETLKIGDFLLLDTCSYNPVSQKGTFQLSLEGTPLFKAKMKKSTLKILDYCSYNGDIMDDDMDLESFNEEPPLEAELEEEMDMEEELAMPPPSEKPEELKTLSKTSEIPFPVVVEVDRLKMSLGHLLSLEPGNVIDLSVRPEQGVYLTVHGKRVAKGELIKLGEALGVKIVEIGESS
jgi:flagellar motor switch protein FliN/FliY